LERSAGKTTGDRKTEREPVRCQVGAAAVGAGRARQGSDE